MELHGMAHDIGHLVETAVIKSFHGVKYASLNRFQSIYEMWHRTLKNNI